MDNIVEIDRIAGSAHLLRDLIQERLGLSFDDQSGVSVIINNLASRLKPRDCKSYLEYYHLLMSGGAVADEEWRYVMAELARSKSGFWRHADAVRTLVDVALPQLISKYPKQQLRIWSACCATGEEPLSIAMAVKEAGWFERAAIEIHASDASYVAIESAKAGLYPDLRVDQLDGKLRDKYFKQEPSGWRVAPELQKLIQWKIANVVIQDEVADLAKSHVIFCRNVFIYFSGHRICKTLRMFAQFMPAGSYLFSDRGEFFTSLVSSSNFFDSSPCGSDVWIRRDAEGCDQ